MENRLNQLREDIKVAEQAVLIATNVFNETNQDYIDSAIHELVAAEMRLKNLQAEYEKEIILEKLKTSV